MARQQIQSGSKTLADFDVFENDKSGIESFREQSTNGKQRNVDAKKSKTTTQEEKVADHKESKIVKTSAGAKPGRGETFKQKHKLDKIVKEPLPFTPGDAGKSSNRIDSDQGSSSPPSPEDWLSH